MFLERRWFGAALSVCIVMAIAANVGAAVVCSSASQIKALQAAKSCTATSALLLGEQLSFGQATFADPVSNVSTADVSSPGLTVAGGAALQAKGNAKSQKTANVPVVLPSTKIKTEIPVNGGSCGNHSALALATVVEGTVSQVKAGYYKVGVSGGTSPCGGYFQVSTQSFMVAGIAQFNYLGSESVKKGDVAKWKIATVPAGLEKYIVVDGGTFDADTGILTVTCAKASASPYKATVKFGDIVVTSDSGPKVSE